MYVGCFIIRSTKSDYSKVSIWVWYIALHVCCSC